ncbi:iron chelate uptake ABC transporter family permease subunit [Streptomyces sp. NPDC001880]
MALSRRKVFDSYRYWVVGALGGRDFDVSRSVLPFAVAGLVPAAVLGPGLDALALGDSAAASPGGLSGAGAGGLSAATLLSVAATAAVGPIAFVGLAVPHVVRALVGVDFRMQILCSLLARRRLRTPTDHEGRTA